MIVPSCHCIASQHPGPHHPNRLAVAEPQPLNQTQLAAASAHIIDRLTDNTARDIVFRKDDLGNASLPQPGRPLRPRITPTWPCPPPRCRLTPQVHTFPHE